MKAAFRDVFKSRGEYKEHGPHRQRSGGMQYRDVKEGDIVAAHFIGNYPNGRKFENSWLRGKTPLRFQARWFDSGDDGESVFPG